MLGMMNTGFLCILVRSSYSLNYTLAHLVCFLQLVIALNCARTIYAAAEESACETTFGIAVNPAGETCLGTFRHFGFVFGSCCSLYELVSEHFRYLSLCEGWCLLRLLSSLYLFGYFVVKTLSLFCINSRYATFISSLRKESAIKASHVGRTLRILSMS